MGRGGEGWVWEAKHEEPKAQWEGTPMEKQTIWMPHSLLFIVVPV